MPFAYNRPVKIVVAFDKFKSSLTAAEACQRVRETLLAVHPYWEVAEKPMADGGDGTAVVLQSSLGGEWRTMEVMGPLPEMRVAGRYLWVEQESLAVIEMATVSGLVLLRSEQRNPLRTTTHGTGELIADAIQRGAKRILLGIGGSATNDGGVGAAMAVGWQFRDQNGKTIGYGGGELERIARIVPPSGLKAPPVEVLCDVDNPLCGERGAAAVYSPQKGATPSVVQQLDDGLQHLAEVVRVQLGKEILDVPGAGAAGGLGGGALAFLNARLVPGVETIIRVAKLESVLCGVDWIITGEGRFDSQSLSGKVVHGVLKLAQQHQIKVAVIAGSVDLAESEWRNAGISEVFALRRRDMTLDYAIAHTDELLTEAARRFAVTAGQSVP